MNTVVINIPTYFNYKKEIPAGCGALSADASAASSIISQAGKLNILNSVHHPQLAIAEYLP